MLGNDVEQFRTGFLNLLGGDENFRSLALGATQRLMDEHAGVRERAAFAFFTGAEEHRAHAGSHAGADGGHIGLHKLHGVVDGQAAVHLPAGGIQVHGNVGTRVLGGQEEELGLDDIGHVIVDGNAQEDDAVHHEAAENIHLGHVELTFLGDGGIDVSVQLGRITREGHR